MKYQINSTGNIILADQAFVDAVHPGDYTLLHDDPVPTPIVTIPAFDFYRRLTAAERIAIRMLAATDPIANDFLHTLDSAIASGTAVSATDPDLLAGMAYLQVHPAASPCLTAARVATILA